MFQRELQSPLGLSVTHDYRSPVNDDLAGGDLVALTRHDDGSTSILIGDLSAKGSEGAAYASWLATLFQVSSAFMYRPARILGQLNRLMADAFYDETEGLFACAFVCRIFPRKSYFIYSCAGAEPPILFSNAGVYRELRSGGTVLGVDKSAAYEDCSMPIAPDDALVAFTDGITESFRFGSLERLGASGVVEAVRRSVGQHGAHDSFNILSSIDVLNAGSYFDDATLMVASMRAA